MRFLLPLILMVAMLGGAAPLTAAPAHVALSELSGDGYVLSPAYPNPFNPATRFTLSVAERQSVVVEVFNTLGQRVQLLYSGTMDRGESRTFVFDASSLPSGIYLYRVTGRNFQETRNITLMK
jgi:hypothetical protein